MSDFMSSIDTVTKIAGFTAVAVGAIGALIQYVVNSRSEELQRANAILESDIKVSAVFSELIQVASGYAGWSAPQVEVINLIEKNLPPQLLQSLLMSDPRVIGRVFAGSMIPQSTPLARQLAAAESIANLAIKYPILLEPALVGLDVTAGFSPLARVPYERLCEHYKVARPLTDWGPNFAHAFEHGDVSSSARPEAPTTS